jgi:hypothetical protein
MQTLRMLIELGQEALIASEQRERAKRYAYHSLDRR